MRSDEKEASRKSLKRWGEGNGFENSGGYMNAKKAKLAQQFREDQIREGGDGIFKGVCIFVNGYTDPPSNELRNIMSLNGGQFDHYYNGLTTTHIIASNLAGTKLKKLKGTEIIVKPQWITDSLDKKELLDFRTYQLTFDSDKSQPKLNLKAKTANDPNFIEEYFSNSRLHQISEMAIYFKEYVNKLREHSSSNGLPGLPKLKSIKSSEYRRSKIIMHVDMDCFFVSVGLLSRPDLVGKPVAVTHSKKKSQNSKSEIACCSYEARKYGVKNGMLLGNALKLCRDLECMSYDFPKYTEVAQHLYDTIASYTLKIQAVSCDELMADMSFKSIDPIKFGEMIKTEVYEKTKCNCSIGFGPSPLVAKLALRKAKPNGVFSLMNPDELSKAMKNIPVSELPGIRTKTLNKLMELGLETCGQISSSNYVFLQKELGTRIGRNIFNNCKGIDYTELEFVFKRTSVSVEINYGIRFETSQEAEAFVEKMCAEVSSRLNKAGLEGRSITVKLLIRAKDAPEEPSKFMGHGIVDKVSRTTVIDVGTKHIEKILQHSRRIFKSLCSKKISDVRGIGISIGKLNKSITSSTNSILEIAKPSKKARNSTMNFGEAVASTSKGSELHLSKPVSELTMSQIDQGMFETLPEDIRKEVKNTLKPSRSKKTENAFDRIMAASPIKKTPKKLGRPRKTPIVESTKKLSDMSSSEHIERTESCGKKPLSEPTILNGVSDLEGLRSLLTEWVASMDSPTNDDVQSVIAFFLKKVKEEQDFVNVRLLLLLLRRLTSKKNSEEWTTQFNRIFDFIQKAMFETKGAYLYM